MEQTYTPTKSVAAMSRILLTPEQQNALEVGRHLVVRANAGSGKTFLLTLRIVRLLVEYGTPIENIVAITFTTKAAAQMRKRVQEWLLLLLADEELLQSLQFSVSHTIAEQRIREALAGLGKSRIATFHSFAAGIIRQYGIVLDINPESKNLTDREKQQLLTAATRNAIQKATANGSLQVVQEMLGIVRTEALVQQLAASAENLDSISNWLDALQVPIEQYRSSTFPVAVASFVHNIGTRVLTELSDLGAPSNEAARDLITGLEGGLGTLSASIAANGVGAAPPVDSVIQSLSKLFTQKGTARKSKSEFGDLSRLTPLPPKWKELLDWQECWGEENEKRQAKAFEVLVSTALDARNWYEDLKNRSSAIDFDDMMRRAVQLLKSQPGIAASVQSSIQHLMVDELQDTNPLQYEFITLLVPDLLADRTKKAELFVVGDDKQSIYGFRNADVRLFRKLEENIDDANARVSATYTRGTGSVRLQNSYRITPPLAKEVNRVCASIFSVETDFDVEYSELISALSDSTSANVGSFRFVPIISSASSAPDVAENGNDEEEGLGELQTVVSHIMAMVNDSTYEILDSDGTLRQPTYADIAVLVRRRQSVAAIARLLQQHHIPVRVHGGREFYSRTEVADIRNLLIALTDPNNGIALSAVLRSAIFRLTDVHLFEIAASSSKHTVEWDALEQCVLSAQCHEDILRAATILSELKDRIHTDSIASVVRDALQRTGWHGTLYTNPRRKQIRSNVDKLLEIIRNVQDVHGTTAYDVISEISIPGSADNESEAQATEHGVGVQVMTLHASKGLEFPIVIVADISSRSKSESIAYSDELALTFAISSKVPKPDSPTQFLTPSRGGAHLLNGIMESIRSMSEAKRLLYVALTRAKFHVVVILSLSRKKDGEIGATSTLVSLLLPHVSLGSETEPPKALPLARGIPQTDKECIDSTVVLEASALPDTISVTDLVSANAPHLGKQTSESLHQGTIVHNAIAELLLETGQGSAPSHPIIDRFIQSKPSWIHLIGNAAIEQEHVGMLGSTLVVGRPDVYFGDVKGHMHVWDWKVIHPANRVEMQAWLDHYKPQLLGYAWLLMNANSEVDTVHLKVLFVPLATANLDEWSVGFSVQRDELSDIEAAMQSRMAVPAA